MNIFKFMLVAFVIITMTSCNGTKSVNLTYIVPNDYEGFYLLKFDETIKDAYNHNITIKLQRGGETLVPKSPYLIDYPRKTSARFENGDNITCMISTNGGFGLWSISASSEGILLLIGLEGAKKIHYESSRRYTIKEYNDLYEKFKDEDNKEQ